jgi:glyoxylase-like metal-dependent hydrolase (beta-lactamase superfamily II)
VTGIKLELKLKSGKFIKQHRLNVLKVESMTKKIFHLLIFSWLSFLIISCSQPGDLVVLHQATGPIDTNCYLLYDARSREAALIDVGGPIDSLVAHIHEKKLKLKYIFATHVHMDHVEGVPQIHEQFFEARLCYNKEDYEDFLISIDWMAEHFPEMTAEMKQSPEFRKWFEYDMTIFKEPDLYLEDNQIYKLGNLEIQTLLSPGHSRGSICFHVGDVLFSGDILFYRQVGRTDLLGGSKENIVKSVRRLYSELPDMTKVYPGHGEFTDIGSEKKENKEITIN